MAADCLQLHGGFVLIYCVIWPVFSKFPPQAGASCGRPRLPSATLTPGEEQEEEEEWYRQGDHHLRRDQRDHEGTHRQEYCEGIGWMVHLLYKSCDTVLRDQTRESQADVRQVVRYEEDGEA